MLRDQLGRQDMTDVAQTRTCGPLQGSAATLAHQLRAEPLFRHDHHPAVTHHLPDTHPLTSRLTFRKTSMAHLGPLQSRLERTTDLVNLSAPTQTWTLPFPPVVPVPQSAHTRRARLTWTSHMASSITNP